MPRLDLRAHIAAPIGLVYEAVADVEQYPAFLPDVAAVEKSVAPKGPVLAPNGSPGDLGDVVAMTLKMGPLPVRLVTRARFTPPEAIDLTQIEGPFRSFTARWSFAPEGNGTAVHYEAEYELPMIGLLFGGIAGPVLEQQTRRQIRAFEARVRDLAAR